MINNVFNLLFKARQPKSFHLSTSISKILNTLMDKLINRRINQINFMSFYHILPLIK